MKISTHVKSGEKDVCQMLSESCLKQNLDKQGQTKIRKSKREKRFQ